MCYGIFVQGSEEMVPGMKRLVVPTIVFAVLIAIILGTIVFSVLGWVFLAPTVTNVLVTLTAIFIVALALAYALLRGTL